MFSGLLALFTDYSKSITNFRKRQFAAAVRNAMVSQSIPPVSYKHRITPDFDFSFSHLVLTRICTIGVQPPWCALSVDGSQNWKLVSSRFSISMFNSLLTTRLARTSVGPSKDYGAFRPSLAS